MNELERALVTLGRGLDVPEAPDLTPSVLAALTGPARLPARRRWAVAVALAVAAAFAAVLAVPDARSAFLRVLSFGGEEIHLVDELPAVPPDPAELDLDTVLGRRMSLDEARATAGFPLRELDEEPDRVYVGTRGTVWFLYGTPSDVRLLVAQTPGVSADEPFLVKKLVESGAVEVDVGGRPALFLGGGGHVVMLLDADGMVVEESVRLAQNVLLWEDGDLAVRLEGAFSTEEALELAEALRVRSPG